MDSYSHKLANILVGNDIGDALLEFTFIGPEIEILEDMAIAVTGGESAIPTEPAWIFVLGFSSLGV